LKGGPVHSDDPGLFTTFDVESRVNGEIPLSTTFRWRAAAPTLDLDVRGEASIEDPSTFNEMFVPVSGFFIASGAFETLSFEYVLSDRSGRGWVDAVYDSLVVRAVEPSDSTDTRTVTDWFLGRKIRTSHVPGRDPPRSGEIAYDRQEWNSFFAFVWFSLRSGIQAMVLE
jgi:hypothetical protein